MTPQGRQGPTRKALLGLLLLIVGAVLALRWPVTWDAACTLARRHLPDVLGLDVGIGQCELDPLGQKVIVRGFSLFLPGEDTPLFAADSAEVQLGLIQPPFNRLPLDLIRVQRPRVALDLSRPSKSPPKQDGACPLDALGRLRVARIALNDAEVRLVLPGERRVEVSELDVGWSERWGVAELDVEARRGLVRLGADRPELVLGRLTFTGALDPEEQLLEVHRSEVALDDVSVNLSGRIEKLCDPSLALDAQVFLPLRALSQAKLLPRPATGHLWARFAVNGRPAAPTVSADVSASGLGYDNNRFGPTNLTARAYYAGDRIRVEELVLPVGAGRVKASGTVLLKEGLPVEVDLATENASLGRILDRASVKGSWVDFPASLTTHLTGTLLPRPQLGGEVDLRTGRFVLATRAFDAPEKDGLTLLTFERGHAQTTFKLLPDRVTFSNVRVDSGKSRLRDGEVTLYFDGSRGLDIHGQAELELSDFGHIAGLAWSGRGPARFSVVGPYSDVKVDSSVTFRDFTFWGFGLGVVQGKVTYANRVLGFPALTGQKGRTQYFGRGGLTFGRSLLARAEVTVPLGRTEDMVDVLAGLHPSIAVLQGTLGGTTSGRIEIDSPVDKLEGLVVFDLKDTTYYGRRMGNGETRLRFVDGKAMVLERTVLQGPLGRTWAEGTWTWTDGSLDYEFGGDNLSLAEMVDPELAARLGVRGTLALSGRVEGNNETPIVTAELRSPRVTFADRNLGELGLQARMVGRDLQVWGKPFADASGFASMKVREPFPYDISVKLALPEIRPLLPEVAISRGVSGELSGEVTARGNLRNLEALHASASVDRLSLSRGDFRAENDGPILLDYAGGKVDLQSLTMRGPDTTVTASGWMAARDMEVSLRGRVEARLIESLLPGLVERTGGIVDFTAAATGTPEAPRLMGNAELTDARLSWKGKPLTLRGLSGRIQFTEQRVVVESLQGLLNDGRVTGRGDVQLDHFQPQRLQATLQLDQVSYRAQEDLPVTASGSLQLTGTPEAMVLSGDVDIVRLHYQKGLDMDGILKSMARRPTVVASNAEKPREYLALDVNVHLEDVRVDNNLARARLLGDLRLTGTNLKPGLLGRIEATEGSQAFFRNTQFAITEGQMEFRDRQGFDPVFEVYAQSQVREYTVKLHAFGRMEDPQVLLTSEPALSEGDIVSLLTLGVTSTDKDTAASASAGLAAEALFNVSGLDRHVQRFLPSNPVLKDLSFQISTTYNDATQQAEPTARLESKFLSEQLKIGMTQPVSGRGTRARAEYRFDNRLSAQAQWDNENSEASFGNLGLELKLSWEVE
ncbi:translocation/assembly module TamB [Myxococcaceae bacterium GXIMD 01537]